MLPEPAQTVSNHSNRVDAAEADDALTMGWDPLQPAADLTSRKQRNDSFYGTSSECQQEQPAISHQTYREGGGWAAARRPMTPDNTEHIKSEIERDVLPADQYHPVKQPASLPAITTAKP